MSHASDYLSEVADIASQLEAGSINLMVDELRALRERGGQLHVVGMGGSAANAIHAINDFIRLCGIRASSALENIALFTATGNDDGWNEVFSRAIEPKDALLVLSVGGGALNVSFPICLAIDKAKDAGIPILGIVGRDGGYTKKHGDCVIVIPTVNEKHVTPHTEAFQMVILHALVSHPDLQRSKTKW